MTTENKPTNWKNVAKGTPVLFRMSKDSEYEAGTWEPEEAELLINQDGRRWRRL
jgi:glucose-6-phosphate 1-dehydrogenase